MSLTFDSTTQFSESIKDIDTLINYAQIESQKNDEKNRLLFLKLAVVSTVTKFQVFIESVLKEYHYYIKNCGKKNSELQLNLRLNSLRIYSNNKEISKLLENYEKYNADKLNEIKEIANRSLLLCDDNQIISDDFFFETKYPLGKTGLDELTKLFRQIEGKNIFENISFDINKFNEILFRRHAIIHEDSNPQLTEAIVHQYKEYMIDFSSYIDGYLTSCKLS